MSSRFQASRPKVQATVLLCGLPGRGWLPSPRHRSAYDLAAQPIWDWTSLRTACQPALTIFKGETSKMDIWRPPARLAEATLARQSNNKCSRLPPASGQVPPPT